MIYIVRAVPEDIPVLQAIAVAAKGHWGYPEEQMAAWAQQPLVTPEAVAAGEVFTARVEGQLAGWYRLVLAAAPALLDDLWVLPAFMGRGVGRALFEHASGQTRTHGLPALELDADPNAVGFYEHLGCRTVGQTQSEWGRLIPRMRCEVPPEP